MAITISDDDGSDSEETMDSASVVAAKRAYHNFMLPPHPKRVRTFVGSSVCAKPDSWRPSERLSKVEFTRIPVSRLDLELKHGEESLLAETAEFGELRKMYESLEQVAFIATNEAEGFLEKVNDLEAQVAAAKKDLDDAKKERDYVKKERADAKKERDDARKEQDDAKKERDGAKKERDGAKKERDDAKKELYGAKKERDDAKKELDDVKKERDDALLESFLGMEREKKISAELDACRLRVAQLEADRDWIFSQGFEVVTTKILKSRECVNRFRSKMREGYLLSAEARKEKDPAKRDDKLKLITKMFEEALVCDRFGYFDQLHPSMSVDDLISWLPES